MTHRRIKRKRKKETDWSPVVAVLGVATGSLGAYVGAEAVLYTNPHPLHWLVALAGGVLGYLVGMVWYWLRGDVI